jgi:hypothetical protein
MSPTCTNAVRSFRVIAHLNLGQARAAKQRGLTKLAAYHLAQALEDRAHANNLARTAR